MIEFFHLHIIPILWGYHALFRYNPLTCLWYKIWVYGGPPWKFGRNFFFTMANFWHPVSKSWLRPCLWVTCELPVSYLWLVTSDCVSHVPVHRNMVALESLLCLCITCELPVSYLWLVTYCCVSDVPVHRDTVVLRVTLAPVLVNHRLEQRRLEEGVAESN